ncbi:hypothetical protein LVJ94_50260 [Pendulispora rubella]|uniref:Uncharacterized protein n=1 Tax=Pendulispora rubella TaxID=2741070 RepID=A0ABZ2L771_9BACT
MKIHTFVGWGAGIVGIFGIAACGASAGDGSLQQESSLATDDGDGKGVDEVREAAIDLQSYIHKEAQGYSSAAWFRQGRVFGPGWNEREIVEEGNCTATFFEPGDAKDPERPPVFVSAGDIFFSGAKISPNTVMRPDKSNYYPKLSDTAVLWVGGEDIRIDVLGSRDGVGAIKATLKAPSLITLSSPSWEQDRLTLDRAKDLDLAWTQSGVASGTVKVRIEALDKYMESGVHVTCAFPVSSGKGVVSARVLKHLPLSSSAWIDIQTAEEGIAAAPPWNVKLRLHSGGSRANGRASTGPVNVE